ncbi:MAG: FecR domain-containing protein [Anaerolineales bacterium]
MSDHYPFETILDFVEGRLQEQELKELEAHLGLGCGTCETDIATVGRLVLALEANRWPLPSPASRQAAVRAFGATVGKRGQKRRRLRYALAGGAIILVVLLAVIGPWKSSVAPVASLVDVSGSVSIQLDGQSTKETAFNGQEVPVGASIQTGSGASATLSFPSGDAVIVRQNSSVSLRELEKGQSTWQVTIYQAKGRTESVVDPGSSEYRVQTDSGQALAVGTRFIVDIEEQGTIRVSVSEGEVQVSTASNAIIVPAGKTAYFAAGQGVSLSPPTSSTPEAEGPEPATPAPTLSIGITETSEPEAEELTPEPSEVSDGSEAPDDE